MVGWEYKGDLRNHLTLILSSIEERRTKSLPASLYEREEESWIPAFAGMTKEGPGSRNKFGMTKL